MFRPALFAAATALAAVLISSPPAPTQEPRFRLLPRRTPPMVGYGPTVPQFVPVQPFAAPPAPVENNIYDEVRRRAELAEIKEFSLFRAATPPLKLGRSLPEWERARYLILAVPENVLMSRELFAPFAEVMRHALDVTDVLVMLDGNRPSHLKRFVRLLEDNKLQDRLVPAYSSGERKRGEGYRIHVVPLEIDTLWVRDYGPAFATTDSGKLCILDSMYRDLRQEQQKKETSFGIGGDSGSRRTTTEFQRSWPPPSATGS